MERGIGRALGAVLLLAVSGVGCSSAPRPQSPAVGRSLFGDADGESKTLFRPEQIEQILKESDRTYRVRLSQPVAAVALTEVLRASAPRKPRRMDPFLEVHRTNGKLRLRSHLPDDALEPLFEQASEAFASRDFEEARRLYLEAVRAQPEYFKSYTYLGNALYFLGRYVEAEKVFDRAIDLNPFDYQAHLFLGDTLHQLGDYERAKQSLTRAFMLNRENIVVLERLQSTLAKMSLSVREGRLAPPVSIELANRKEVVLRLDRDEGTRWYAFAACMACWAYENECKARSSVDEDPLRLSMYRECLLNHAVSVAQRRHAESSIAADDRLLLAAIEDGYLEAIVFWEVVAARAPAIILLLPEGLRIDIQHYIDRYVYVSTQLVDSSGSVGGPSAVATR